MKKIFLILSLIALLVFSSCEFGTPEAEKSYYKGAIEIGTSSSSLTRSLESQYKKEFESGDMISVFVYQEGKTDPVADNAILKYDGTGAWTEVVYREAVDEQAAGYYEEATEEEKKMAWTGEGGAYTFIATYPAITNDIKITNGKVSFDLYNNPAQLFVEIINGKAAPTTAEEAKVTLTLDPLLGGVQTKSDLASGMKISAYTAFTFDVTSGGFETVGSKKSLSFSKDEDGYYCSPWLIPQEITISGNGFSNTLDIAAGKIITIEEETKVESISLNTTSLNLEFNGNSVETYTLTPTYYPTDAYTKNAVWTSSDERVATVEDGVVTIVGPGSATITLSVGEVSAECQVTVNGIKFCDEASYSGSGTEYTIKGTYGTLSEPLVAVCGDYTITLDGITVGSESSRVTQPIVRVMGGTLTIKLSGENTVYTTSVSTSTYGSPGSRSVIHLVGENANVNIIGDLGSEAATSTESPTNSATLKIYEYMIISNANTGLGHDALIGGSAGDTVGNITIKDAIIEFDYSCSRYFSGALIGAGSYSKDSSGNYIAGSTGELNVSNSIINAAVSTTTTNVYFQAAVIGSGSWSTCGNITIDGSKITLSVEPGSGGDFSSPASAIVGTGCGNTSNEGQYGTPSITVTDSMISAEYSGIDDTFYGSLIGSGQYNKVGDIHVSGSTLKLTYPVTFYGSVIGAGAFALAAEGEITVLDSTIDFTSKGKTIYGSIIGAGYHGSTAQKRGDITVRSTKSDTPTKITISGVNAIFGSVIGAGASDQGQNICGVGNITVDGLTIDINKAAGTSSSAGVVIGAGREGSYCKGIEIKNLNSISITTTTETGYSPVGRIIGSYSSNSSVRGNISIYLSEGDTKKQDFLDRITVNKTPIIEKTDIGGNCESILWFDSKGDAITN